MQERAEQIRRQKVISREWREDESQQRLAEFLQGKEDEEMSLKEKREFDRNMKQMMQHLS